MNKKQQQAQWNRLAGVRAAIKGWAFSAPTKLPSIIAYAESERNKLTLESDRIAADALIQPLREA